MARTEGNLVKAPHKKQTFTVEQMREFAACCDPITGCEYFLRNFFYIQHPTKGQMLFQPYDYQIGLINTYVNYRNSIALMPRQTGKSTTAAGYLLWYAMFNPDSTVLIAAHVGRGAMEIMDRVRYAYECCPDHIRAGAVSYNKGSLDFDNGSRIKSSTTTETTGRGMSISLLYADEFSYVRSTIASVFWSSIAPTLATGGKCIITSTPNSDEDMFATMWRNANKTEDEFGNPTDVGINGFKAYLANWWDHPDRDQKWADEMKAQLGEEKFAREIECRFIVAEETLVSPQKLQLLESSEPVYKQGQIRWFRQPEKGRIYVVALDPAVGTGGDSAAIQVFDALSTEQVAEWKHNKTPIPNQIKLIHDICSYIESVTGKSDEIYYSVENNSVGVAALTTIQQYGEENIPGYFLSETGGKKQRGFNTNNKTKVAACSKLKNMIEQDKMKIHSRALISELKTFIASGGSYAAKIGEHDDLVSATLIAVRMMTTLQHYHRDIDQQMRDFSEDFQAPLPWVSMTKSFSYI